MYIYTHNTRSASFNDIFKATFNIFLGKVWYIVNLAIFDLTKNIPSTITASTLEGGCEFTSSVNNDGTFDFGLP